jgi:signal transduction histidine kinase
MKTLTSILLVEDSPSDAALLKHVVRRSSADNWQLSEAETLADATALCKQSGHSPFDLVLLDLGLPDSQGLETLKRFRQAVVDVPVVILTGLNSQALALAAVDAGAQDYLVKDDLTLNGLWQSLEFAWRRQQQVNAAKSSADTENQLMGMISHEFRNPLGAIQNAVEVLLNDNEYTSQRWLQRIQRSTDQLLLLMEDTLLFTRVQSDGVNLSLQDLPLNCFCQDIISNLSDNCARDRIHYKITDQSLMLRTDPILLRCILTNLLSNAVKYSLADCPIDFLVSAADGEIQLQITDQGIGIPKDDLANILDSFYRASNVGRIAGSGLGLAIVSRCLKLLGGQIQFDSVENQGTSVTVKIRTIADEDGT